MDSIAAGYYHHHPPPPQPAATSDPYSYYNTHPPAFPAAAQPPQYSYYPPPPPHYASSYVPSSVRAPPPESDEVRTIFIAGLPGDTKLREINNLFTPFPGFSSSQLRTTSPSATKAYAFAVFDDQRSAIAAMHALNGLIFDLEKGSELSIQLAKANSWLKHPRTDEVPYSSSAKRTKVSGSFTDSGLGSNLHMPGMGNSAYSLNGSQSSQSLPKYAYEVGNITGSTDFLSHLARPFSRSTNSNPCPTIYVANLEPSCSQKELTDTFARCPGFLKLKVQRKHKRPIAFIDFLDVNHSTAAINHLQGHVLSSSAGEGMHLEYAKSRMGMPARERPPPA